MFREWDVVGCVQGFRRQLPGSFVVFSIAGLGVFWDKVLHQLVNFAVDVRSVGVVADFES
jgi:hypothetical protein